MDIAELHKWGYNEAYASSMNCDLKGYWAIETACNALGLDTRPKMMGGPNICYNFQHWDPNKKDGNGNAVPKARQTYTADGKEYRVSSRPDVRKGVANACRRPARRCKSA